MQTLPPANNRVPGHGAHSPGWEHKEGRRHWPGERVGPAVRAVGLVRQQGMWIDCRHGSNFLCAPPPPGQASEAKSPAERPWNPLALGGFSKSIPPPKI